MRFSTVSTRILCFALAAFCLTAFGASAARAAETRLNQQLAQGQSIISYKVSPDGKYAVYILGEQGANDYTQQLFSVNIATREVKALTPRIGGGKSINQYDITPTNRVVIYSDAVTQYNSELYSVAITGGTIVKLNRTFASGSSISSSGIQNYKISPDGARVVYYYYESPNEGDNKNILYSVPTTGGTSVRLTSQTPGAGINNYIFTPNSQRLVYEFQPNYDTDYAVYSIALTGGAAALLTNKFYADYYQPTYDSQTFVYQADLNGDGFVELYSTPITGGARTQLSLANEDVNTFKLSNQYLAAVYSYKLVTDSSFQPNSFGIVTTDARNRYAIATGKRISGAFQISPDNRGIVFPADGPGSNGTFRTDLYSATLDSRGQIRQLSDNTLIGAGEFKISPDGSRVVFFGFPAAGGGGQLYSVPTIDGGITRLSAVPNSNAFAGVNAFNFQFTADGKRVAFIYDAQNYSETSSNYDLFSNAIAGGSLRKAAANTDDDYSVTGSSTRIVYTRSVYTVDNSGSSVLVKQLYSATL